MTLCRLIAPNWLKDKGFKPTLEGLFTDEQIEKYNQEGYNVYSWPNAPTDYDSTRNVDGSQIDSFRYVFIDFDSKTPGSLTKDGFLEKLLAQDELLPSRVVDSGNGIHAYWQVSDLDANSYLRLCRRLMRHFDTDPAVGTIAQLMRLPGTLNTKLQDAFVPCETLLDNPDLIYSCETLDLILPPITIKDETHCVNHYNSTYNPTANIPVDEAIPPKFGKLLTQHPEAQELWSNPTSDRSKADYRLGHIMYASGFTKPEALSVLVNSAKALTRGPSHRMAYAVGIVEKIWTYEAAAPVSMTPTVRDILSRRPEDTLRGTRFPCNRLIDDTEHGYRLGQVMGIVGGSGVGKTTLTLNAFLWFAENNPDYHHFFFSLEQPSGELASRIRTICGVNESLYDKIHIVSNYNDDGTYNHFSLQSIEELLIKYQETSGSKAGAVVIDHIGVLAKETKNGESDGLIGVCRKMKETAVKLNLFLIMLSQAPRAKAGIGDLELNKDAAYGTIFFESFVDYLVCLWQPLKRAYSQGAPTVMAVKFAKIRHKRQGVDKIQEDVCYQFYFDPTTERLRQLNQVEETAAKHYLTVATNLRKMDRETDLVPYVSRRVEEPSVTKTELDRPTTGSRRAH